MPWALDWYRSINLNFKVWFVFMYRKGHLYAWSVFEKLRRLFSWNEAANYSLVLKSLVPLSWRHNATNCRDSGIQGFKSFTAKITRDRVRRRFTRLAQIIKGFLKTTWTWVRVSTETFFILSDSRKEVSKIFIKMKDNTRKWITVENILCTNKNKYIISSNEAL